MTDTVDTLVLITDGRVHHARFTNESDGTGESSVKKVDMSALTTVGTNKIKAVDIERCFGIVGGFNYVTIRFDASTDDEALVLAPGTFDFDFTDSGGIRNPLSASSTGDIMFTTDGAFDGASYNITLECTIRNQ